MRKKVNKGLGVNTIVGILQSVRMSRPSMELFTMAPIYHKKSYLKYLHWMLDKRFITRNPTKRKGGGRYNEPFVFYQITKKGEELLMMLL